MSYREFDVATATGEMEKHRAGELGEIGAALVVVGLSADRVIKESQIRDDMIRVAHRTGASVRQLAEAAGLGRKAVSDIVAKDVPGKR